MASYRPETIDRIAAALTPSIWLRASEVRSCLAEPYLATHTVRCVLHILVRQGRAVVEGDGSRKWYRGAGSPR